MVIFWFSFMPSPALAVMHVVGLAELHISSLVSTFVDSLIHIPNSPVSYNARLYLHRSSRIVAVCEFLPDQTIFTQSIAWAGRFFRVVGARFQGNYRHFHPRNTLRKASGIGSSFPRLARHSLCKSMIFYLVDGWVDVWMKSYFDPNVLDGCICYCLNAMSQCLFYKQLLPWLHFGWPRLLLTFQLYAFWNGSMLCGSTDMVRSKTLLSYCTECMYVT